jgi:hypothetical protein
LSIIICWWRKKTWKDQILCSDCYSAQLADWPFELSVPTCWNGCGSGESAWTKVSQAK